MQYIAFEFHVISMAQNMNISLRDCMILSAALVHAMGKTMSKNVNNDSKYNYINLRIKRIYHQFK